MLGEDGVQWVTGHSESETISRKYKNCPVMMMSSDDWLTIYPFAAEVWEAAILCVGSKWE